MKKFVFIIFVLLCVSSTYAAITDDLLIWYSFDDSDHDGTNLNDLSGNSHNGTISGSPDTGVTGVVNEMFHFAVNDYLQVQNPTDLEYTTGAFTFSMWVNLTDTANQNRFFGIQDSPAGVGHYFYIQPDGAIRTQLFGNGGTTCDMEYNPGTDIRDGDMHHLILMRNGTDCDANTYIFIDGSSVTLTTNNAQDGANLIDVAEMRVANNYDGATDYRGGMDLFGYWDRELNATEIQDLYNSGSGYDPYDGGGGGPAATLDVTWDIVNQGSYSSADNPLFINFTGDCQNCVEPLYNCFLEVDHVLNQSNLNLNFSEGIYSHNFSLPFGLVNQDYELNVSCFLTAATSDPAEDHVNATIKVDTIFPTNTPDSYSNNSLYFHNIDTLINFTSTGSDANLYAGNSTIEYLVNGVFNKTINNQFVENINTTSYVLSVTNITNELASGAYRHIITWWDSHTAIHIPDYPWSKYTLDYAGKTYKGIDFANGYLNLSTDDYALVDDFALIKRDDRYLFAFNFNTIGQEISLFLDSKKDIKYLSDKYGFDGHFIIGSHWVDFESDDVTGLSIDYLQNYGIWRVRFTPLTNIVVFNSIGDLNTYSETYYFNVTDGMTFNAVNPAFDIIQNITVVVFNDTDVIQQKTGVGQNVTFNISSGLYYTNVSADGYINNGTGLINFTAGGSFTYTLYAQDTFYLLFKDEDSLEIVNGTTIYLDLISDSFANNYSTSDGTLTISVTTPENYTFRYGASGYQYRLSSYELLNNSYSTITLYMLTGGSNVSLKVVDEVQDPVEGATINVYRYNTLTNSYLKVNTIDTDFRGESIVNMDLNSEFYYFTIYYDSQLKKQTSPAYITSTSYIFGINLDDVVLEDYFNINEVDGYLTFNQNTHNFRFFFNDPNNVVSQGCLYVYTVTAAADTLYNSSCVAAAGGTALSGVVAANGTTYLAKAYITYEGENTFIDSLYWSYGESIQSGNLGYFLVIVMTIVFIFIGYWSLELAFILTPLPTIFASTGLLAIIPIPTATAIGLEVVGVVLAIIANKYMR